MVRFPRCIKGAKSVKVSKFFTRMFEILTVPLVLVIGDRRLPTLRFRGKYLFERECVVVEWWYYYSRESALEWTDIYILRTVLPHLRTRWDLERLRLHRYCHSRLFLEVYHSWYHSEPWRSNRSRSCRISFLECKQLSSLKSQRSVRRTSKTASRNVVMTCRTCCSRVKLFESEIIREC